MSNLTRNTDWKKGIGQLIDSRSKLLHTIPDEVVKNTVYRLVDLDNYTQILLVLGKEYVEICLNYFESVEDYSTCAVIMSHIESFNKTQGTDIKLERYEVG